MSAIVSDIDQNDVHDVTQTISDLATNASALAVNAIAVAKSASQLRLNEKLLTTVSKLSELDSTSQRTNKTGNYHHNDTAPLSGFSSRATTLAPVFSNTSRISIMPTQTSPENVLPAATSSGVENSLTSISTLNKQKNTDSNNNNRTPSTKTNSRHNSHTNSKRHSQTHSAASHYSAKASTHKNQSNNTLSTQKTRSIKRNNEPISSPQNNSRVYETLYDTGPVKVNIKLIKEFFYMLSIN